MRSVSTRVRLPASVHEAETCWYDTAGWPRWVDGLAEVVSVEGDWPRTGASVTWDSGPAGRGRVVERVIEHTALSHQTLDVGDGSIRGRQRVTFTPADDGVEIHLGLEYEITQRSVFTPLVDLLFIRRAMEISLRTTLARFGSELAERRARGGL